MAHRAYWEVRRGRWGLLLLLATHQLVIGSVLAWDTFVGTYEGPAVILPSIWPGVFVLGSLSAWDMWRRKRRRHVNLAEGLMLLAYGSRAMALWISGVTLGWQTTKVIGLATWVALFIAAHRAWDQARSTI